MIRATRSNDISDGVRFHCPVGERKQPQYQLEYDAQGNKVLVHTGDVDIPEMINSYAADCDINRIVRKHAGELAAGDYSALNKRELRYGDAVGASTNYADYHNSHSILKGAFENDPEAFEKFSGDFSAYLEDRARGLCAAGSAAVPKEEVKENGNES